VRTSRLWPVAGVACLAALEHAQAARPMATDDTATAPGGECQIEAWGDRADAARAQILAPACGLTDELELDTAVSRIQGGGTAVNGLVAGLKWVPESAAFETPLGAVALGLEGGTFWARDAGGSWRGDGLVVVALSSLAIAPGWNLYANLAVSRLPSDGRIVTGVRAAVAWQPAERWLLFVEGLADNASSNVRNAGLRWWAVPNVLGLDIVTTRSRTSGTTLSVGFGWYGIQLR
jgi:hypothetical protein